MTDTSNLPSQQPTPGNPLEQFLEERISRLEKSTRMTWLFGLFFAAVIFGYMSFVYKMITFFLDGENAAQLVAQQVETYAPDLLKGAEDHLKSLAPELATQMSLTFLQALPKIRQMAESQIDATHQEMIPFISKEFQSILDAYITENRVALETLLNGDNPGAYADQFVEELMVEFGKALETHLKTEYGDKNIAYIKENMLLSLDAMNLFLEELLAKDIKTMTRQERLQRRVLALLARKLMDPRLPETLPIP